MIQRIKDFFTPRKKKTTLKYSGLSDFMLNATPEEKIEIITKAAQSANDDQQKVFEDARLKVRG